MELNSLAERRELVVADGGHLVREVAPPEAPRGLEELVDLALQRAHHHARAEEREQEGQQQDAADRQAPVGDLDAGELGGLAEQPEPQRLARRLADLLEADAVGRVAHRHLAALIALELRARERGRELPAAEDEHRVELGQALDLAHVLGRVRRGHGQRAELPAVGAHRLAHGMRHGRGAAGPGDHPAGVVAQLDRLDTTAHQLSHAPLGGTLVAARQRLPDARITRNRREHAASLAPRLLVHGERGVEAAADARVGLAALHILGHGHEHQRHGHHRDRDEDREEQREQVPEAH